MSDTNEIRNGRQTSRSETARGNLSREGKSIVSVSTFSNNLRSFLQQLFTDNNNQEYNNRVLFLFRNLYSFSLNVEWNVCEQGTDVKTAHYLIVMFIHLGTISKAEGILDSGLICGEGLSLCWTLKTMFFNFYSISIAAM